LRHRSKRGVTVKRLVPSDREDPLYGATSRLECCALHLSHTLGDGSYRRGVRWDMVSHCIRERKSEDDDHGMHDYGRLCTAMHWQDPRTKLSVNRAVSGRACRCSLALQPQNRRHQGRIVAPRFHLLIGDIDIIREAWPTTSPCKGRGRNSLPISSLAYKHGLYELLCDILNSRS